MLQINSLQCGILKMSSKRFTNYPEEKFTGATDTTKWTGQEAGLTKQMTNEHRLSTTTPILETCTKARC